MFLAFWPSQVLAEDLLGTILLTLHGQRKPANL